MRKPYLLTIICSLFAVYHLSAQDTDVIINTLKDHKEPVKSVAFSPDGKILATGSEDRTLNLYKTEDYTLLSSSEERYRPVFAIAFTPDGKKILAGAGKYLEIFTPEGAYVDRAFSRNTDIMSVDVSLDSKMIVTGTYNKTFQANMFDADKTIDYEGHDKSALAVDFNHDASMIASGSLDQTLRIWKVQPPETLQILEGHGGNIVSVAFSPSNNYVATASLDKSARLWEVGESKSIQTYIGHQKGLTDVAFTNDGLFLLTTSYDHTIRLWEVHSGKLLFTFTGHEGVVNSIALSPDGNTFATASDDESVIIWKLKPRVFVEELFFEEIQAKIAESDLFLPKQKAESRAEYQERQEKAADFKAELYNKYFSEYINELKSDGK